MVLVLKEGLPTTSAMVKTLGANLSYDEAFDTRFTADIKYRFGSNGYGTPNSKKKWKTPAIEALSATPANRDVRVHDSIRCTYYY